MSNSMIKRKKVSDLPVEIEFVCNMLAILFANQSLCLFSLAEKGELVQLLRIPSDLENAKISPLKFFSGCLSMVRLMKDERSDLRILVEQPRRKNQEIEVDVTSIPLTKTLRSDLSECFLAPCTYRSNGLITIASYPKDGAYQVQYVWVSLK